MIEQAVEHTSQSRDVEEALWAALRRDNSQSAREKLFDRYANFARRIARRHFLDRLSGDIELADLQQLAYAGLLEAIEGFDPDNGASFTTYALRRVSGSVLDGITKMSELREQISFRNRVRDDRVQSLRATNHETISTDEAINALAEAAVGLALGFMLDIDMAQSGEGAPDPRAGAYDSLAWKETVRRVGQEVANLPERERLIIRQHYLNGMAFDQIAGLLNVTKGRVSQLHRGALALLRKRMRSAGEFKLER